MKFGVSRDMFRVKFIPLHAARVAPKRGALVAPPSARRDSTSREQVDGYGRDVTTGDALHEE